MTRSLREPGLLCFGLFAGVFLAAQPAKSEVLASASADSRLVLAFDAPDASVADTLPEGWSAAPFGSGPFARANVVLVFVEAHQYLEPYGNPKNGGRYRGMSMVIPARFAESDETVFVVNQAYISDAAINPYYNSVVAEVTRQVQATGTGSAPASIRESWAIAAETGGEVALSVAYQKGVPARSNREIKVYSNVDPDFYRIYRTTQYTDVVMSVPMGVDNVDSLALDISIPAVRAILDGTEELVGVLSLPWYMRKTIVP